MINEPVPFPLARVRWALGNPGSTCQEGTCYLARRRKKILLVVTRTTCLPREEEEKQLKMWALRGIVCIISFSVCKRGRYLELRSTSLPWRNRRAAQPPSRLVAGWAGGKQSTGLKLSIEERGRTLLCFLRPFYYSLLLSWSLWGVALPRHDPAVARGCILPTMQEYIFSISRASPNLYSRVSGFLSRDTRKHGLKKP